MTTAYKPDFAAMGIEGLQEIYSEMLATAADLGFTVPEELTVDFDTTTVGLEICEKLHEAITKFSAGLDASDEKAAEKKALANGGETGHVDPVSKKAGGKKKSAGASTKKAATPAATNDVKEKTMTKTATKTATKTTAPKKTAAKKAAGGKKAATTSARTPVKKTGGGAATGARALKATGVIHVKTKDNTNPCREGSGKHERVAQIFKFNGKTVEQATKAGVRLASLNYCAEQGWISIK